MIPLTNEKNKYYPEQKFCYTSKREFITDYKKYQNIRDHCHYTEKYSGDAYNIQNLRTKKRSPCIIS